MSCSTHSSFKIKFVDILDNSVTSCDNFMSQFGNVYTELG